MNRSHSQAGTHHGGSVVSTQVPARLRAEAEDPHVYCTETDRKRMPLEDAAFPPLDSTHFVMPGHSVSVTVPSWWPDSHHPNFEVESDPHNRTPSSSQSHQLPRSALRGSRDFPVSQKFRFAETAEIYCHGTHVSAVRVSIQDLHDLCRTFWHLDGQICDGDLVLRALARRQHGQPFCHPAESSSPSEHSMDRSCVGTIGKGVTERWLHNFQTNLPFEFERQCLWIWADLLENDVAVNIFQVFPTPQTLISAKAHFLVFQGPVERHSGVIIYSDVFPVFHKHRAVVVADGDSVDEVLSNAQFPNICIPQRGRCYVDRRSNEPHRTYGQEAFPHEMAQVYDAGALPPETEDSSDDEDGDTEAAQWHNDEEDASGDDADTVAPDTDVSTIGTDDEDQDDDEWSAFETGWNLKGFYGPKPEVNSGLRTDQPIQDASCHEKREISDAGPLQWGEIPLSYKIQDMFDTHVSWASPLYHQADFEDDHIMFMQRDRSRSREGAEGDRQPATHAEEASSSSGARTDSIQDPHGASVSNGTVRSPIEWRIAYTEMPSDTVRVTAYDEGPSLAQIEAAVGWPSGTVRAVYPVRSLIALEASYVAVVECFGDGLVHPEEVATLFDILCLPDVTRGDDPHQPHIFHSVHISRSRIRRAELAAVLRVGRLLTEYSHLVSLWLNGDLWDSADDSLYTLRDGDHIQLLFNSDADGDYRWELGEWLLGEGLNLWPSLLESMRHAPIPQTMPYAVQEAAPGEGDMSCDLIPGQGFITWFISHTRHPTCREGRVVLLARQPNSWRLALERVWEDRMEAGAHFTVTWIHPNPPPSGQFAHATMPHLMVEQHHRYNTIGVFITHVKQISGTTEVDEGVFSVTDRTPLATYYDCFDIERQCRTLHVCTVTHENRVLNDHIMVRRPTGQSVVLSQVARGNEHLPPASAVALMQTSSSGSRTLLEVSQTNPGTGETATTIDLAMPSEVASPQAPSTGSICHEDPMPTDEIAIQRLQLLISSFGFQANDNDSQEGFVQVFFLSPRQMPNCRFPRVTRIGAEPATWRRKLVALWSDYISIDAPVEIFVAMPPPHQDSTSGHGTAAFIMLVQHRTYLDCPVLYTICEGQHFTHFARLIVTSVTLRDVLRGSGLEHRCLSVHATDHCVASYGFDAITNERPLTLPLGANVLLGLIPRTGPSQQPSSSQDTQQAPSVLHRTAEEQDPDSSSLLQLHSALGRTQGTVSHAAQGIEVTPLEVASLVSQCTECRLYTVSHKRSSSTLFQDKEALQKQCSGVLLPLEWTRDNIRHFVQVEHPTPGTIVYVPLESDLNDVSSAHCCQRTATATCSDIDHMRFLHSCGIPRAVIHEPVVTLPSGIRICTFSQQEPHMEERTKDVKHPTPWPSPQAKGSGCEFPPLRCDTSSARHVEIALPCTVATIRTLLYEDWIGLRSTTDDLGLASDFVLTAPRQFEWKDFDRIVISTDGSFLFQESSQAHLLAWAFVVTGERYGEPPVFLGWNGDRVQDSRDHERHVTSSAIHSTKAEKEALLWATLWRLSLPLEMATVFLSDSSSGLQLAEGTAGALPDEATALLRSSTLALQQRLTGDLLRFSHTKGHAGQFWNELADRLASKCRDNKGPPGVIQVLQPSWKLVVPHLWTILQPDWMSLDASTDKAFFSVPDLPAVVTAQPVEDTADRPSTVQVDLCVASANVLSLYGQESGGQGKVAYLQGQFESVKLHLVGVQETRGTDGCFETPRWLRLTAGGHRGTLGVELWVSKTLPYAYEGNRQFTFRKSHFAVVDKSPRHMLVRIDAPALQCWILVGHAPHSGTPEEQRREWWQSISALLQCHQATANCLVCIDANSSSGPALTNIVFDSDDEHDHSSRDFQEMLRAAQLCLPASDSALGPWTPTWTSPDGQHQRRIDFVCLPWWQHHRCVEAFVCPDIDLNFHGRDHTLTGLHLRWQEHVSLHKVTPAASHKFDRHLITPSAELLEALHSQPSPPWSQDVESQHRAINDHVRSTLARQCPLKAKGPKKPFITPDIWQLRGQVLQARKLLKRHLASRSREWAKTIFTLWKEQNPNPDTDIDPLRLPLPACPTLLRLVEPPATAQAGLSPLKQRTVKTLRQSTWFFIQDQVDRVATTIGSRPGDCFADWVFSVLFARVLQSVKDRLIALDLIERVPMADQPGIDSTVDHSSCAPWIGPVSFGCMRCRKPAKSKAGEAAHQFKVHGISAKVRSLFDTTQCRSCLKEFHTVAKIQRHLQTSRRCRQSLRAIPGLAVPLPGIGSGGDRALQELHDDLLPPLQAEGPVMPRFDRDDVDGELLDDMDAIGEALLADSSGSLAGVEATLRAAILARVWSWTRASLALHRVADELTEEDAEVVDAPFDAVRDLLRVLARPSSWDFLDADHTAEVIKGTTAQWTAHLRQHEPTVAQAAFDSRPRAFSKDRIVLHLFSGRRRHGDLQEFLEKLPPGDGQCLHVVSIDLVFDPKWGDLADQDTQKWWLHSIQKKWVVAMLAGPPCCTWSKARGKAIQGRKHTPRVVRTPLEPWGLGWLAIREWIQVTEGNVLLFFCVEAIIELWLTGGAAILEHPARPEDSTLVSIWETAPLRLLRALPGIELCFVWQGLLGAKSAKPTHLLVLNMPDFKTVAHSERLTTVLPQSQSIGLTASGEWQTSSLKEYPPCFNRIMAHCFHHFFARALVAAVEAAIRREEDRQIIASQNAEYEESLRQDELRRIEEAEKAEREKQAAAEAAKQEEEKAAKALEFENEKKLRREKFDEENPVPPVRGSQCYPG
eukprot:Skav231995  [mRNA]  locus=scaffold719:415087:427369:- [translate_table: standard]